MKVMVSGQESSLGSLEGLKTKTESVKRRVGRRVCFVGCLSRG